MEKEPKTGLELSLKSQAILDIARIEALALNDARIGPEHLMMAFLKEGYVRQVFATFHVGEADFRQKLAGFNFHQSGSPQQEPTLGRNLQMLVEKAAFDAAVKGKPQIAPVHHLKINAGLESMCGVLFSSLVMATTEVKERQTEIYRETEGGQHSDYSRVETPTAFYQVLAGLAQGWVDQTNWSLRHLRELRNDSYLFVTLVFENPAGPADSEDPFSLKNPFNTEFQDIVNEHRRYIESMSMKVSRFDGIFRLGRLEEECSDVVAPFNAEVFRIEAHFLRRRGHYDGRVFFVDFSMTDLDERYKELGTRINSLQQTREELGSRIATGIPLNT